MHVELDSPYSGFLRQSRRTRVIKRLASVSRTFFWRILPHLRSWMPPQRQRQRQRRRLTTGSLSRVMGMLNCGCSQQGLPSSLAWAKLWQPEHGIASRRLAQLPSAMLVVDNEQPRIDWTNFLWRRPDVIHSWMRLLYEMSWGILLELTFPRIQFLTVFGNVVFALGEHAFAFPWPDFTNRRVWTGQKITSLTVTYQQWWNSLLVVGFCPTLGR